MNIHYTEHLNRRIIQRELIHHQIEETIKDPDHVIPTYRGRYLAQKVFRDRILEVVARQEAGITILITAYWLSEKGDTQ